ncbi:hypothetical protein FQZ97_588840 [compost metagenome]
MVPQAYRIGQTGCPGERYCSVNVRRTWSFIRLPVRGLAEQAGKSGSGDWSLPGFHRGYQSHAAGLDTPCSRSWTAHGYTEIFDTLKNQECRDSQPAVQQKQTCSLPRPRQTRMARSTPERHTATSPFTSLVPGSQPPVSSQVSPNQRTPRNPAIQHMQRAQIPRPPR